ncbi:N-acetyltransferase [Pararhizobium sp. YC-54]|uniref:GNAT family N-acetyltransferase n=1 Tax=Pararhizobium sp. YC-54 TaxID=2986920 RepID=UPI0021F78667|nr:N-acetyltransferase [Pararhizobium sp. YC-54]MCV9997052.1 N-acetyltransferase [Pararhizobium sp. YC-54]
MITRFESPADIAAIRAVTIAAFKDHPHSDQTEHLIVDRLRHAGALSISLVTEVNDDVVGHIAFSPVELSDGSKDWFGLGPVSVLPAFQGQGIGGALIRKGLDLLREQAAAGCVVVGDPDLYQKFGFRNDAQLVFKDCAPQYFLAQPLSSTGASGMVTYDAAFYAGVDGQDGAA